MATRFGVFVPQGWRMDLVEIDDPIEQYEAMTRAAQAADARRGGTPSGCSTTFTPSPHRRWRRPSRLDDHRDARSRHRAREDRPDGRLQRLP